MAAVMIKNLRVLVVGSGQLGLCLCDDKPASIEVKATNHEQLDVTDAGDVHNVLSEFRPDWVINCAAYTAVDNAEKDSEQAFLVNEQGARNLAATCKKIGAKFIQVSTDFVFDGEKSTPYEPEDSPNPLSVYGSSKLAGELAACRELNSTVVVRTSWLYSPYQNNFVKTMLQLMQSKQELKVVCDQIGSPTSAHALARYLWQLVSQNATAVTLHYSDAGVASWYDFAENIQRQALSAGILERRIPIFDIPASQYEMPAKRPSYSVLQQSQGLYKPLARKHWLDELKLVINQLTGEKVS